MKEFLEFCFGTLFMILTSFVGNWDEAINIFLCVILASFVVELMASIKEKRTSWAGFCEWCGRQVTMIVFVCLGHAADILFKTQSDVWRDGIVFFYIAVSTTSIVKYAAVLGVTVPDKVIEMIDKITHIANPSRAIHEEQNKKGDEK